ncbi:hypothetical protein OIU34_24260 [Pararhizobium sp. BT-229]|uniref:hypothetical protein n=1 Tax=Pararhizobium sp. BT-229 TaxID=2986923 RepID=UPI0021F7B233|nr:hypothetical protein [Pararhizobium sp. BT-229]MCV9965014.1 hypothetical protein [Pararhizobium sp. BT-229]
MDYVNAFKAFAPETVTVVTRIPAFHGLPFPTKSSIEVANFAITWVRSVRGDVVISLHDRPLRRISTFGDRGSFLDLLADERIREIALATVEDWKIAPENDVEVCVRAWIEDTPTLGIAPAVPGLSVSRYYALSNMQAPVIRWYEGIDPLTALNTELPIMEDTHSITRLWSNRWSREEAAAAREAFRARADEAHRTIGEPAWMTEAA